MSFLSQNPNFSFLLGNNIIKLVLVFIKIYFMVKIYKVLKERR